MQNRLAVLAAFALLLLALVSARAKDLEIIDRWGGTVGDAAKASLPDPLAVRDKETWDYVWKATHPDDPEGISPPAVDFDTDVILIGIVSGPNRPMVNKLTLDDKGNVDVAASGTKMGGPGFGFIYLRVAKEGIKTVNGKALVSSVKIKSQKSGSPMNGELEGLAPASGAITDKATFLKIWTAWGPTDGSVEKPWEVDFDKEIVLVVTAAKSSVKVEDVTLDTFGDVKIVSKATPIVGGRGGAFPGFGYVLMVIEREGVMSVNGKPLAATTQTKSATAPAK